MISQEHILSCPFDWLTKEASEGSKIGCESEDGGIVLSHKHMPSSHVDWTSSESI